AVRVPAATTQPPAKPEPESAVRVPAATTQPPAKPEPESAVRVPAATTQPPAKPEPEKSAPVREGKSRFFFKAASFNNTTYANTALTQYLQLGLPAYLEQNRLQDKTMHRVLIGPFENQEQAETAREQIRKLPNQSPGEILKR
ncbi:MAG: SPOR domain-containing protein, partial [Magnetococcales bacterium]|nr:SPOR domain-containing protein [Magnetococcales bacterium]